MWDEKVLWLVEYIRESRGRHFWNSVFILYLKAKTLILLFAVSVNFLSVEYSDMSVSVKNAFTFSIKIIAVIINNDIIKRDSRNYLF